MSKLSPTQRTLRALRQQGRICAIAERWNPHVGPFGVRKDLFGWIDIIVLDPQRGIGGIQSTGQAFNKHVNKLLESECTEIVIEWLKCGGFAEVWGWRRLKLKRGSKALRWVPRIRQITLEDFGVGYELQTNKAI